MVTSVNNHRSNGGVTCLDMKKVFSKFNIWQDWFFESYKKNGYKSFIL